MATLLAAHAGAVSRPGTVVFGWPGRPAWRRRRVTRRRPVDPFARQFVYAFAIAPALVATVAGVLVGWAGPVGALRRLCISSGLANRARSCGDNALRSDISTCSSTAGSVS